MTHKMVSYNPANPSRRPRIGFFWGIVIQFVVMSPATSSTIIAPKRIQTPGSQLACTWAKSTETAVQRTVCGTCLSRRIKGTAVVSFSLGPFRKGLPLFVYEVCKNKTTAKRNGETRFGHDFSNGPRESRARERRSKVKPKR